MKKTLCVLFALILFGGVLWAQEEDAETQAEAAGAAIAADPRAAMAAAAAAEGMVMPGQVTTPIGRFTLHGMVMTGLQGYMTDNTALDKGQTMDEEWGLMAWDPVWQQNGAKVSLVYENGRYGGFIQLEAGDWDGNIESNFDNIFVPYAFAWRSFFDDKLKASLGMLYGENFQTRERLWKTEGATNGGWDVSESNRNLSLRLEYKPIAGLDVGIQGNFLPFGQNTATGLPNMAESLKEIAVGAEYKSDLFNVVAGVRFDGDDGMNKFDTYTYLKDYYGDWGYVGGPSQNAHLIPIPGLVYDTRAPHWKHIDEVYGQKVWGDSASISFGTANNDKPFDGSTRVIFGFNFKGVKNLTAKMQASFWNLGDFERFGTGSFDETIGYAITPKFGASVNFYQDFYGGDAFPDNMVNSPYFRFEPVVSYQLTRNIGSSLLFTYGVAKDVIESDWRLKPGFTFTLGGFGSFRGELYYELNAITYTDEAVTSGKGNFIPTMMQTEGGKAIYKHTIGLSVMWMF